MEQQVLSSEEPLRAAGTLDPLCIFSGSPRDISFELNIITDSSSEQLRQNKFAMS